MSWGQYWVRNMFFRSLRTSFHNFGPPNPTIWTLKKSRFFVKNPIFCDFDDFFKFQFYNPQIERLGQKCVLMAQICSLDVLDTCKYHGYLHMILKRTFKKIEKIWIFTIFATWELLKGKSAKNAKKADLLDFFQSPSKYHRNVSMVFVNV